MKELLLFPARQKDLGASVFEAMVAATIFLIVIAGLLPLIAMTMRGGVSNDLYTQATNAARAKLEEIKNLNYVELGICKDSKNCPDPSPGIGPALNQTTGLGYLETDPYGDDTFTANADYQLSDRVTLKDGNRTIQAVRKITVEAIDDSIDGSNAADSDGLIDANTKTVIDYKLVTVSVVFNDPISNKLIGQSMCTIVTGLGGDDDQNGNVIGIKPKGGPKPPPPPPSLGHSGSGSGPGGRKGRRPTSAWSGN